jgi:hypothetical protein
MLRIKIYLILCIGLGLLLWVVLGNIHSGLRYAAVLRVRGDARNTLHSLALAEAYVSPVILRKTDSAVFSKAICSV